MSWSIDVGDVVEVDEADYCYGMGTLILRVTEQPEWHGNDQAWMRLQGMQIRRNRTEVKERDVLVRVGGLRRFKS